MKGRSPESLMAPEAQVIVAAMQAVDPEVRVLICSGFSAHHAVDSLLARGARGFLAKPIRVEDLGEQVALHARPPRA